jgi:hypothetical protein
MQFSSLPLSLFEKQKHAKSKLAAGHAKQLLRVYKTTIITYRTLTRRGGCEVGAARIMFNIEREYAEKKSIFC